MAVVTTNLGPVTAYGDAVRGGYTGTKEQWEALMADYGTIGTQAQQDAQTASTAAQTATTKASEASASATQAQQAAASVSTPDTTLTQSGKAADAKAAGDAVAELKENLSQYTDILRISPNTYIPIESTGRGYVNYANGNVVTQSASFDSTDYVNISAYKSIKYKRAKSTSSNPDTGMAFYDKDKQYISGVQSLKSQPSVGYDDTLCIVNVPESAVFARFSIYFDTTTYGNFELYGTSYLYSLNEDISDVDSYSKNIADYHVGKNLCNNDTVVAGAIQQDGSISTTASYANYVTSDYISITPATDYVISEFAKTSLAVSNGRKMALFYDANKSPIPNSLTNVTGVYQVQFNKENAYYVRVSVSNASYIQVESGTTHTEYSAYNRTFDLNPAFTLTDAMLAQIPSTLAGKKWAHCGDSFSHYTNAQFSSGVFNGKDKTFPRLIAERNGMTLLEDFMYSGRTLAYPSDGTFTNALTAPNQTYNYQNIPSDVDYVTIMLGINDCQHVGSGSTGDGEDATGVITLGTIDDATTATYYGAWNVVLGWLRENRPFAHVGIIVTNGTTRQDYTEAQIAVAHKWGYPLINLNGDDRTPAFIRCYNPNIPNALKESLKTIQGVSAPSNTHPNWQTHELESTIIEAWLRTL